MTTSETVAILSFAVLVVVVKSFTLQRSCSCSITGRDRTSAPSSSSSSSVLLSSLYIPSTPSPSSPFFDDNDKDVVRGRLRLSPGGLVLPDSTSAVPVADASASTFWTAVPAAPVLPEEDVLPVAPYGLDDEGPLPYGSYRRFDALSEKKSCVLEIAVETEDFSDDPSDVVDGLHRLVDAGITSFSIGGGGGVAARERGERRVYGALRKETPRSIVDELILATTLTVPPAASAKSNELAVPYGRGNAVRRSVASSLTRSGADCLDDVRVVYRPGSPYHLDVLDTLVDLRREGRVRSFSAVNFPPSLVREAREHGFDLPTNQVTSHVLRPYRDDDDAHGGTRLSVASPLAGGLLTDDYDALLTEWSPRQFRRSPAAAVVLSRRFRDPRRPRDDPRAVFRRRAIEPLREIGHKHRASVAAVATRWAMQRTGASRLGSVVVASRVGADERWFRTRPRDLREALGFELDDADLELLEDVSESFDSV